eukprot:6193237-Ditylum_brightwellii.AAC.1
MQYLMLLPEAMSDLLDEVHEHTLAVDVIISGGLEAVVMSATLDAEKFQEYFHGAQLMKVPRRTHPVEVFYIAKLEQRCAEAAVQTALQIHQCEGPDMTELVVCPIYLSLPPSQHRIIFNPAPPPHVPGGPPGQKVVVSATIAETSLDIIVNMPASLSFQQEAQNVIAFATL